jgi:dUTPase
MDFVYPNEIKMVIHNPISKIIDFQDGSTDVLGANNDTTIGYEIKKGDKIGQLILCRHEGWLLPSEYTRDEERLGGFGSTGN